MTRIILIVTLLLFSLCCEAQTISKLTITDNLAASSKFGYGKPKPAPAKDQFEMVEEKGTQVLFYADIVPSETSTEVFKLLFVAYRTDGGKDEWVDERLLDIKKTSTYALTAVNFFTEGSYKVIVTNNENKNQILAQGNFTILKN